MPEKRNIDREQCEQNPSAFAYHHDTSLMVKRLLSSRPRFTSQSPANANIGASMTCDKIFLSEVEREREEAKIKMDNCFGSP